MKTEKEIRQYIKEIQEDSRYDVGNPATVEINAPLALIQCSMEAKVAVLKWVLGEQKYPSF